VPLVTRPPKSSGGSSPAATFASDGVAAVLSVLRESAGFMTAIAIKKALQIDGVMKADIDRAWPTLQKKVKAHDHVVMENGRYRWSAEAPPPGVGRSPVDSGRAMSASAALEELARSSRLGETRKAGLLAIIAHALGRGDIESAAPTPSTGPAPANGTGAGSGAAAGSGPSAHPASGGGTDVDSGWPMGKAGDGPTEQRLAEARRRQAEIDAVRALAELASEVEELTANEVTPDVMVRQVRAWVRRSGLEAIDRAGQETAFDRKRHKPIGPAIRDGAPVLVVRPGYVWKTPTEDVLIGKAVVEE
jgi:hypothetical protein